MVLFEKRPSKVVLTTPPPSGCRGGGGDVRLLHGLDICLIWVLKRVVG